MDPFAVRFQEFAARKTREAAAACIERLTTVLEQRDGATVQHIGNAWSRLHYDGQFGLVCRDAATAAMSLVFVQTRNGNTGGPNPGAFGGGATDTHLIYEGLSRVAADAVLAGAGSVHRDAFFSVWHPELVALRASLGLPRHPAQVVVSKRGRLDFQALLFNVPGVRVFLIGGEECVTRHAVDLQARPWIELVRFDGSDLRPAVARLRRERRLQRWSAIGGRFTATQLVDMGLAQDIYLTTTSLEGGEPSTPWYAGTASPRLTPIASKQWHEGGLPVAFDHYLIN